MSRYRGLSPDNSDNFKTKQPLSTNGRRLARIYYVGTGASLVIGYALYFAARLLPPPTWALQVIEALKPALGSLTTAGLVSDTPFPAQVVITYSATGFVVLSVWFAYSTFLYNELRETIRQELIRNANYSRPKLALAGCVVLLGLYLWVWFVTRQDTDIGWQELTMLSPGLGSVTMQLLMAALLPLAWPRGLYAFWTALTWRQSCDAFPNSSHSDQGD